MGIKLREYQRCPFCEPAQGDSVRAYVTRTELVSAFMNPRQFERGSMLIIPNAHRESIIDVQDEELAAIHMLSKRLAIAAVAQLGATGITIYQRNGTQAGQHVPHYHVHIIPRYPESNPDQEMFFSPNVEKAPFEERKRLAETIKMGIPEAAD